MPRRIVDCLEAQRARVRAAHEDRERIVEAERRQERPAGARVQIANGGVDAFRRPRTAAAVLRGSRHRLMENRGERGAGVFDIHVDVAPRQRAVADQRAAQIEAPFHGESRLTLDRLRKDLAEHELLGEILRSDGHRA